MHVMGMYYARCALGQSLTLNAKWRPKCHRATNHPTLTNRNDRPITSRKVTRSAAFQRVKLSGVHGPRKTQPVMAARSQDPAAGRRRTTHPSARVAIARVAPSVAGPRKKAGRLAGADTSPATRSVNTAAERAQWCATLLAVWPLPGPALFRFVQLDPQSAVAVVPRRACDSPIHRGNHGAAWF